MMCKQVSIIFFALVFIWGSSCKKSTGPISDPIIDSGNNNGDNGNDDPSNNEGGNGGDSEAAHFLHADGRIIKDSDGEPVLLRGIGLGGWMLQEPYMLYAPLTNQTDIRNHIEVLIGKEKTQEFYDAWLENGVQKADIDQLKAWGFNSIRVPLHYDLFTLSIQEEPVHGENTWLDKGFDLLDRLIEWCSEDEIYVILDLHAAPGGQGNDLPISDRDPTEPLLWQSDDNKQKTIALWKKLAERYKNEKWVGGYDLLNETNVNFDNLSDQNAHMGGDNTPLWNLLKSITEAIRQVDKNHLIFIEGNGWANNYSNFPGPWDDNMAISFHKYQYQGDKGNTEAEIQSFLDMRNQYDIPLWLGESGENSDQWYRECIDLMERNNIGWAWWPLKKFSSDNCPLSIKWFQGFQDILNYWDGNGDKPSESDAYQALMQLAENCKFENCDKQQHVVDALFNP